MASLTPKFWSHFHLVQILAWICMIPVALLTGLKTSVPFLVGISLWALVCGEFGSWQASMAERRIDHSDSYGED